jgi:hypothetical protein
MTALSLAQHFTQAIADCLERSTNCARALADMQRNKALHASRPTVCVTGAGAGVDSVREQRKLEARKMLENAAESPASSAPWNNGGASFFTKEHPAATKGLIKNGGFSRK